MDGLSAKEKRLLERLAAHGPLIVAYSGGVDSAYLAHAAHRALGDSVTAITAVSASYPRSHREMAVRVAREVGFPHRFVHTHELADERYAANPTNRCYFCKSELFDLLEELGIPDDVPPAELERLVADVGIGFAFARTFHPAMRHAAPVRAELGIPTVFNSLGPLSHPGHVRRQVIGTADWAMAPRMIKVLEATGSTHAMVVHGHGGLDELTVTGPSRVLELRDGSVAEQIAILVVYAVGALVLALIALRRRQLVLARED